MSTSATSTTSVPYLPPVSPQRWGYLMTQHSTKMQSWSTAIVIPKVMSLCSSQYPACAPEHNPDAPTPEPVPTIFSSSSTSLSTPLHDPPLVPEPSHIPTLHDTQSHDDPILRSIPSSPLSVGFLPILTTDSDTEPDVPDPVSTCSLPDSYQDSHLPQPADESAAISDTASPHSPSPFPLPLFDVCGPPGTARPYDDNPLPTLPDSSLRDIGESESVQFSLSEAPPLTEVGATASPPFMTDGRGRVVWSCSAAKRGSSPLAIRSL
ncbi:hypothetical protein EDB89DRAFT_222294 [Lactarius sanguifluus]|nr:hypothetical protein EDB89DRAFT_222294 [Lactarius sanguifluus]